jgi:hypothetical protein
MMMLGDATAWLKCNTEPARHDAFPECCAALCQVKALYLYGCCCWADPAAAAAAAGGGAVSAPPAQEGWSLLYSGPTGDAALLVLCSIVDFSLFQYRQLLLELLVQRWQLMPQACRLLLL